MKIGIVGDDTMDKPDGVEQYIMTIGPWLAAQGHEVHYLVGETTRTDFPNIHSLSSNVKVRFNGNRLSTPLPANKRRIRELLAREQFDILYVQMPYSPVLAGRIISAAGKQTAVVGIFHILPNNQLAAVGTRALGVLVKPTLRRFDAFLSVSSAARDFFRGAFGVDSQVIPNASYLKPYQTAKQFAEYHNTLTVLCHGRLVERKGCHLFLTTVARLHDEGLWPRETKVLVSGAGPLEARLKQLVAERGLNDIVTFLGFISDEDKPRYMASADVVVYPSTAGESFGIVLIEAMAASRGAVLAGNNPGYASVMNPRPDSLFDPRNSDEFRDKLLAYLTDKKLRAQAHDWQQGYVQQYDVSVVGKRLLEVFEKALASRSNRDQR